MEILALLTVSGSIFLAGVAYGYYKRERQFQKTPITFCVGVQNAAHVDNRSGKTKIVIYDKKLVDISGL